MRSSQNQSKPNPMSPDSQPEETSTPSSTEEPAAPADKKEEGKVEKEAEMEAEVKKEAKPKGKKSSPKNPEKEADGKQAERPVLTMPEGATPESLAVYQAMQRVAELLTTAPDAGEAQGHDMVISYHFVVMTAHDRTEYRNTVTLPAVLSPDNEVDALGMIESQMDLATRPAKNFAMRMLREFREHVLRIG